MENIKEVLSVIIVLSIIVLSMAIANVVSSRNTPHCEDSIVKIYKDYNDGKIDILTRDTIILETVKYLDPLDKVE